MIKKLLVTLLEILLIAIVVFLAITLLNSISLAEDDELFTAYIICQKDDYIHARMQPTKKSRSVGRFDGGDPVLTDGYVRNGFLRCYGFESGVAWVHTGYVVYDEPVKVDRSAYSISNGTLKARRYIGGKVINKLKNLDEVKVIWWSDEWCVTSKGFIQTQYLELDGE